MISPEKHGYYFFFFNFGCIDFMLNLFQHHKFLLLFFFQTLEQSFPFQGGSSQRGRGANVQAYINMCSLTSASHLQHYVHLHIDDSRIFV